MTSKPEGLKPRYSKPAGLLLVCASMLAIVVLYVLDITFLYEPKHLLGVTNTIFTLLIPVTVAYFAAGTYLKTGFPSVLLMGCGMLVFGLCAGAAGWLREIYGGANFNVTIYNTGSLLGSLCHVTGAVISYSRTSHRLEPGRQKQAVIAAYSAIIVFAVLFSFATVQQVVPPFFIQGSGPTALRQIVLGLAVFFYALSSLFSMNNYFRLKSDFFYWYSICLAMLALGLFAFYIQKVVGSPIGWVGRTSNYAGTIFSLIAILAAVRSGRSKGLPLEEVISGFFVDAEANYKSLVETASDAIISFDQENRVIFWNSSAEQIFGYTKGEAVGSPLFGKIIPEEYANNLEEPIGGPQGRGSRNTVEIEGRHKNGGLFPIELSAFARKPPSGRVSTCIVRDVTERKRVEETLRTTVRRFHKILSNIFSGILVVTEDDRIEFVNQNFCDQFDIAEAPSDLIGLTAREMLQKILPAYADPEANSARIRQVLSRRHRIEDEEIPMRNGRVYARDHIPILVDGKPRGRMWQHRDITERKHTEEALRKSRDELELRVRERTAELVRAGEDLQKQAALLNLARDAIFVRGLDHTVKFWNDGAAQLYGFTSAETLGKVTQELLHTGFPEPIDQIVDHVLESGHWEGELRQTTSTGQEILVESLWALQRGTDGQPLGFLEINRDVTARKVAEEALRSNMARLELVNAELQEFAHVASHDLQEPLRKIQTFCDMAMKRCAPVLDTTGKDYLDRVINSASRMRQLLRDLLDFSRVATKPEPFKEIDLVKIAWEAADVFEASVKDTGCKIEIKNMPAIEADETQMLRLFQNLIGNALKFRGAEPPRIKVYGKFDGRGACRIFVKDNGIGFEPKFAELIFKPFQRLHGRSEYDGTGMGLAICRKIVERHGGSIRAESEPGKGSTFIIRLPVKQDRWEGI